MSKGYASVVIRNHDDGGFRIIVDGVDMSRVVLAEGFHVTVPQDEAPGVAYVTVTVVADALDADLPASVITALREGDGDE